MCIYILILNNYLSPFKTEDKFSQALRVRRRNLRAEVALYAQYITSRPLGPCATASDERAQSLETRLG